ncbi:MAG: DUF4124 domain-containing protein [Gammaproteobacteria bacterium]
MNRKTQAWLLVLALVPTLAVAGTTIYRWVDAQGVVHYSDQPHKGAKQVQPGALSVIDYKTQPASSSNAGMSAPPAQTAAGPAYQVRILTPSAGTTLWPVNYKVDVQVQVTPSLQGAALLQYGYDGKNVGKPTADTRVELHKVYRGTHTLTVTVMGPKGQSEGQASSTFYVRQHSILHPGRPRPSGNGGD